MIFFRAFVAVFVVIGGFIIYPVYVDNVLTPIVAIANAIRPDMNILEQTYLSALPLIAFLMILFFGIMYLLGKAKIGGSNEP